MGEVPLYGAECTGSLEADHGAVLSWLYRGYSKLRAHTTPSVVLWS